MSRMTKFLKQEATVVKALRDSNGEVILDDYGDPQYSNVSQIVKCRRERSTTDVMSTAGSISRSITIYYFDDSIAIESGDLIDGKPVLDVSDYVNAIGKSEGTEARV